MNNISLHLRQTLNIKSSYPEPLKLGYVDAISEVDKFMPELKIPKHLAENLDKYDISIETEDDIDDFMFNVYDTYEGESYASYDTVKAYLNPLTKTLVLIV